MSKPKTQRPASLPTMPPADGGPWQWTDPKGRGVVIVPAAPACVYDLSEPGRLYRPCGQPGQHYACGWRCSQHAPTTGA
jgi:hypothetical protein